MKKQLCAILTAVTTGLLLTACSMASKTQTVEGTGTGKHGEIKVAVTFKGNKIEKIKVLSQNENKVLAKPVYSQLKDTIVAKNSTDVDVISGSTYTSKGYIAAINAAVKKAGITLKTTKTKSKSTEPKVGKINHFDVVVVGSGGGGFSAAIEAKKAGKKVAIIEKMPTVGGNTLISGGEMNAPGNWVQKKLGIKGDSVKSYYKDTMKGGDYLGDPKMVHILANNALGSAKWLRNDIHVKFINDQLFQFGGHSYKRALIPVGHTGQELVTKLDKKAKSLKIPIYTNMKAKSLIKRNDRIVGVKARYQDKKNVTFNAKKAVILTTGGFGSNVKMRTKYNKEYDKRYKSTDTAGTMGDGIVMAQNVGAKLTNMKYIQTYPIANPKTGMISLLADTRFDGAILVNQEGNRFVEELERRDVISKAILKQTGGYTYQIWNDKIDGISKTKAAHKAEYNELIKQGLLYKADTIDELAKDFKIDPAALKATIKKVNRYAKTGKDKDFHHRAGLVSLAKGPYYIEKAVPSVHHTMGGLVINEKTEVLNKKGKAIPGLYAAGELTGVIQGSNRLGGNAIADIITFGRIAGKTAGKL
ncbi:cytochrome C [Lactobacillus paraplantarum] [Lactiplantibacillus mudanjiangensis]|uniref:flavocytochrome c n=1 Tax=Lactiplantibacillus mudanjiangensis TaxID=1296538 RepID=UPI001014D85E|nr:cytochrome C [Lactobacillus paraplantarum] [Lactiplantibacillus mudanjiangensis]